MKQKLNLGLIIIFMLIITLPYLLAHRVAGGRVSDMENRTLAGYPSFLEEDGKINREYISRFEDWLSDNLRGRTVLVEANAALQYSLFHKIVKTDTLQGKAGWLFANTEEQLREYQHVNLMSEKELTAFAGNIQRLSDYLEEKGIAFYYFQCYNKETVYPDMYPESVKQTGNISRADQMMDALRRKTNVHVIDSREEISEKAADELIYFQYVDLNHWNEKGAYVGYRLLMEEIHKDFEQITVLGEEDYQIYEEVRSMDIYGFAYPYSESCPVYQLKAPKAKEIIDDNLNKWDWLHFKEHTHEYVNENCGNEHKILILGDSFIRMFLKEDIAESFPATLSIDWLNIPIINKVVEEYQPDIVVLESVDSTLGNIAGLLEEMDFPEE